MENLTNYLLELDPTNDDHWTQDGQARTDVVSELAGEKVTRDMIRNAAPKFCRANTEIVEQKGDTPKPSNPWESASNLEPEVKAPEVKEPKQKVVDKKKEAIDDIKPIVEPSAAPEVVVELPDYDKLNAGIAEIEEEMAVLRGEMDELDMQYKKLQAEQDELIKKRDHNTPAIQRQKQANNIRAFIDRQVANRQKRAAK